jgi:hypothetical protein
MPFPLSYENEYRFNTGDLLQKDISDLVLIVESGLRERNAKILFHKNDSVTFKGRYYNFPALFSLLQMVSIGIIKFSEESGKIAVSYNLKFTRMLVFACVLLLINIVTFLNQMSIEEYFFTAMIIGFMYLVLYFVTIIRFNKFIKGIMQLNVAS